MRTTYVATLELDRLLSELNASIVRDRFQVAADMNNDGRITISDVGLWVKWMLFLPGDGFLSIVILGAPDMADFLEIDSSNLYGWVSLALSLVLWPFIAIAGLIACWMCIGFFIDIANDASGMFSRRAAASPAYFPEQESELWRTKTLEEEIARQDRADREGKVRRPVGGPDGQGASAPHSLGSPKGSGLALIRMGLELARKRP
jgi:hypothetical protein